MSVEKCRGISGNIGLVNSNGRILHSQGMHGFIDNLIGVAYTARRFLCADGASHQANDDERNESYPATMAIHECSSLMTIQPSVRSMRYSMPALGRRSPRGGHQSPH